MKRSETIIIENVLYQDLFGANPSLAKEYGTTEVTIQRKKQKRELVDFMSYDPRKDIFRCYEIKVSMNDFHSKAAKSWYGNYNYLVLSRELYMQQSLEEWKEQCQNKIYRSILRRYRHKQFQKINDSENAYQFICFTTEIVYEYKNLEKITYTEFKKIRICSCNYDYLQQRDQKLKNPKPKKNMNTNKSRGSEQTMRYTVTERVKTIKQPRGGFINSKNYETIPLENGIESLHPQESLHATVIGIAVDYMTRYMTGTSLENAFEVSLKGARNINEFDTAIELLHNIQGLDDYSITCAIRLAAYDVYYRTASYRNYQSVNNIFPSSDTIENLRVMVQRSMDFFDKYGPKIKDGITFEGGYTNIIVKGDGDFMTNDTLWDFKTSKNKPNKDHWLQLLIYWRMGMHSIHPEFSNIKYIGIYNPRLNCVYRYNLSKLSKELIEFIDKDVIGY